MTRYTLEIDEALCWGCQTCEAACKQEDGPPVGVKRIRVGEEGPGLAEGRWRFTFRVHRCRHCDDPPCADACPEGAIARRNDGVVVLDRGACTGCQGCLAACPFDAIAFDAGAGTADKCNLCHHRLDRGLLPACADNVCPAHCIHLGGAAPAA